MLSDSDLETAVETCVNGRLCNNGQTCIEAKRFIDVDAMYNKFRDTFVKRMEAITAGDPTNDGS